jgi:Mrp family chromosome partitioning ATPase
VSTCIVEANLQLPYLHQHFELDNPRGLSDALLESGPIRSFAQRVPGGNLWVLPCGSPAVEWQTLLASDRWQSRADELRSEFAYVLIDAPPVSLCAEAISLGRLADGAILVIKSECTRREAARRAKGSLEAAKVHVLGAVLNDRKFPIPETLYRKL